MSKELYVGNLPFDYSEEELRRLFNVAGSVSYIHLVSDPVSGLSKGCAYVKMSSEKDAKMAIDSLDGARVEGRYISVSIARPRTPKAPGAGGRPGKPAGKRPFRPAGKSEDKPGGKGPFKPRGGTSGRPGRGPKGGRRDR